MLFNDPPMKIALAILVVLMGAVFFWQPLKMTWATAKITNDFVLQTTDGALDTKSLRGKVLAVAFGYADCGSPCTDRLARTAQAYSMLGAAERAQVKLILVSVDPEHDTPARIGQYAKTIHPDMVGATGRPEDVKAVTEAFAAETRKATRTDGVEIIEASPLTCIVDAEGRFVSVLHGELPPEKVAAALRGRLPSILPPQS
jgi:protein SCO1/2